MIHVIDVNDVSGDLEEHYHLCSSGCQYQGLTEMANSQTETQWRGVIPEYGAGTQRAANGQSVEYGAWPGGCETDYDEWCAYCGDFLWHGLNCECEDAETDRKPLDGFGELVLNYYRRTGR